MSSEKGGWANPGPAGLVALAIAALLFFALLKGYIDHSSGVYIGFWLLGGFIIQFTAAVIELKEGATTGGNVFLFFAGFFMFTGGLADILAYYAPLMGWEMNSTANGWAWIILAVSLILWLPAYMREAPKFFSTMVADLCVMVTCVTFIKLGIASAAVVNIAAYTALIGAMMATYFAAAVVLNTSFGRVILPVGTPWLT
jgi:hypothetical protein